MHSAGVGYVLRERESVQAGRCRAACGKQAGFLTSQRMDGKLILSEAVKTMAFKGAAPGGRVFRLCLRCEISGMK